jgi:1-acyl-sn-glycerol-3-phosphate acyltransferase
MTESTDHHIGPFDTGPRGPLGHLVDGWTMLASWAAIAGTLMGGIALALVTFRIGSWRYLHRVANAFGRSVLWVARVRLRVLNPERIADHRMRIIAFNHTSQLDVLVISALFPPGGTAIAKKQMVLVPIVGWAFWAFAIPTLDRKNHERAVSSMKDIAGLVIERRHSVVIAPEGTRSIDGKLGPFKMGLFHTALQTRAPIVPMIIRGARECQPMGAWVPRPGVVEVEFLPEIPTDDYEPDNLKEKRDALFQLFSEALDSGK